MQHDTTLVWFRRDLRAEDHAALSFALQRSRRVFCVFVLDRDILDALPRRDRRVEFILQALQGLHAALGQLQAGAGLIVRHARAEDEIPRLAAQLGADAVCANHDDEPFALARDGRVAATLQAQGSQWHSFKDHVVQERAEVLTAKQLPYSVFTPYKNAWLRQLSASMLQPHAVAPHAAALAPCEGAGVPTLSAIGFEAAGLASLLAADQAEPLLADFLTRIDRYADSRDFPALKGPSYLSVHLRFGTLSIRRLVREAWTRMQAGSRGAEIWLSELIWREFYHQLLHHHPHVVGHAFKPEYERIRWHEGPDAEAWFEAWCQGRTGYPLVDAAMRQLNSSGYMHNRLRMVTASFLIKDLGIDWRLGEAYFAQQLLDFDLAANNGGWQWAASTGCDAQPWFRIFNPVSQSEKFDPDGRFIRRYVPELADLPDKLLHAPWTAAPLELQAAGLVLGRDYPAPLVRHDIARMDTLARYGVVKSSTA